METQRTTLSFLTESKASAVGFSAMRRVAMTLLVMLLTTASVWAQVIIPTIYRLSLNANYQGGALTMVDVPISGPTTTYTLTQNDEPIRTDYIFVGWSKSSTGNVEYKTGDPVELTGNLTLYAIWSNSVTYNSLKYEIIGAGKKQVKVSRYIGEKPSGTLNIPATVPINGTEYSVTIIGNNAFEYCSSLESVTIPNSVTSIGNNAFQNCEKLQSITIPNSVTSIGNEAFMDCGITSLTIGMNNIGSEFRDFSSLKSVTILDGVTSIGDEAFIGCSSLASVTIPNSVTSIGNNAFMNCSSLESFTIPNSVTSIGSFAFEHCDKLESFTIPNSVTSVGYGAFQNSGITSLTIGMENIGSGFQEIKKLKSITILDGVKSIGNEAFKNCSSLESVTIPNSVTSIGDYAFEHCDKLESFTIPNSVTSIGNGAFQNSGITSLTIGMENIGSGFQEIRSLKSLTILDGVKSIGDYAFKNCSSLESVTIPNSVTSIGSFAFENCDGLESITIPNSVTSVGYGAFLNSGLTSLTIGMENIGSGFQEIRSLKSLTILDGVKSIGNEAFMNCSSLESFTIPNSVTSIGSSAFEHCDRLESFTIPNSVTSVGNGAFQNSGITSLTIGMINIGSGFQEIKKLKSLTILDGVKSIGDYAFQNCSSLESVTIPNSVTSIGYGAFQNCKELTSITLNGNPRIGADAFSDATVTMNLTASQIGNDYWTTFYNDNWEYNFEADGNTTVYKGTVNESSLMLTEVEDKIVNSGTAVILKSSGKPVMTLTKSGSSDTNGNDLRGISDRTKRTSVISKFSANEIYTMGNTSVGFGFHKYTGEYVPAQKAFLPLNTSDGAKAQSLTIVFAIGSTGINSVSPDDNALQNDWFSLDGTRLSGKPSQSGIYVNGKKKVVIK